MVGAFMGVLLAALFSDVIGRRKTMLISMAMAIAGVLLTVFIPFPWVKFIGLALWGSGSQVTLGVNITIILDNFDYKVAGILFTIFAACVAIGSLANVLLFFLIKNWVSILLFYYAVAYILTLIAFFFFVESPPIEIISHNTDPRLSF